MDGWIQKYSIIWCFFFLIIPFSSFFIITTCIFFTPFLLHIFLSLSLNLDDDDDDDDNVATPFNFFSFIYIIDGWVYGLTFFFLLASL